jgi:hypothetical protein
LVIIACSIFEIRLVKNILMSSIGAHTGRL